MYYVIAASAPREVANEQQITQHIQQNVPLFAEQARVPSQRSTIHPWNIDKSQFKIGSLDLLMQLNETTARIDGQLDTICKKIEKIESDTRGDQEGGNLTHRVNYTGAGTPYSDYIRSFKWEALKYPTKRSLNELTIAIQKNMLQKDEQIRKNMDEFNQMKQKIQSMTKKDTGSLQVRDFTDDIYKRNPPIDGMIKPGESEMFTNLLIVINNEKYETFVGQLPELMQTHYETVDAAEKKRIREGSKLKWNEIVQKHKQYEVAKARIDEEQKEEQKISIEEEKKQTEALAKLQEFEDKYCSLVQNKKRINLQQCDQRDQAQADNDEDFMMYLQVEHLLCQQGYAEVDERAAKRMPGGVLPFIRPIGIEDRESNKVYHTIASIDQVEDVVKACRKVGIISKPFEFDKPKWEEERRELITLKESYENKRKHINQVSTDLFQDCFTALMHLKVIRAYIEGVLRFGIEKKFIIGLVCPKKGAERTILTQMNTCLAEAHLLEYYGEKMDAQEQDDYWPFVCLPLTSPMHVFTQD